MKRIIPYILLAIVGCNTTDNKKAVSNIDTIRQKETQEVKERPKSMPRSEFEITEGGIGRIKLGDSFDSIEFKFKNVDTLTMSSEGIEWRAKRINLGNGEWILAEENYNDIVTRLHTNSKKFKTSKGVHVGQSLKEVIDGGEEVGIDIDEGFMSIRLYDQGISITVDSISENKFYNSSGHELKDIPSDATIDDIGIF